MISMFDNNEFYVGPGEPGSGHVVSTTREASDFDTVKVDYPAQVFISQGNTESVKIEAEDNLLPGLKTEVRNGQLSRAQARQVVATQACSMQGTRIRRSADVVRGSAGGIELQRQLRKFSLRQLPGHAFHRGRTTDVPQADEQDLQSLPSSVSRGP